MEGGAKGVKLQLSGRLGGAEMARCEKGMEGSIPLSTLRCKVEYGFAEASDAQGNIGIKVWVNKGDYLTGDIADATDASAPDRSGGAARVRGGTGVAAARGQGRPDDDHLTRETADAADAQAGEVPEEPARVVRGRTTRRSTTADKGQRPPRQHVAYGDFGLQALEGGWLSAECIEAGRITMTRFVSRRGPVLHPRLPAQVGDVHPGRDPHGQGQGRAGVLGGGRPARADPVRDRRPARGRRPRLPGPRGVQDAVQVPVRDPAAQRVMRM